MSEEVSRLIHQELETIDTSKLHPSIAELPVSQHIPEDINDDFSYNGIDIQKYSEIDDRMLAISTIYALLKEASIPIAKEHNPRVWKSINDGLQYSIKQLENLIQVRNDEIDQIGHKRRRLRKDNEPTIQYLEERRLEALKKIVEIKIESIKLELEKSAS